MRGLNHFPVAGDRFDHADRDRFLFVIAELDLEGDLIGVARDFLPIGLFPLGHDVEGVAHLDLDGLILRRVVDPIFADELQAAVRVGLVDPHRALRQRHAQAMLFCIGDLDVDADFLIGTQLAILRPVIILRPIIEKALGDWDVVGGQQADLLGLIVLDCGRSLETVEMVFKEALLGKSRR